MTKLKFYLKYWWPILKGEFEFFDYSIFNNPLPLIERWRKQGQEWHQLGEKYFARRKK